MTPLYLSLILLTVPAEAGTTQFDGYECLTTQMCGEFALLFNDEVISCAQINPNYPTCVANLCCTWVGDGADDDSKEEENDDDEKGFWADLFDIYHPEGGSGGGGGSDPAPGGETGGETGGASGGHGGGWDPDHTPTLCDDLGKIFPSGVGTPVTNVVMDGICGDYIFYEAYEVVEEDANGQCIYVMYLQAYYELTQVKAPEMCASIGSWP